MKEVTLTQYIHPRGRQVEVTVEVSDDVAAMAERQILSCECVPSNYHKVAIYSRLKTEEGECATMLLADNGPGPNNPQEVTSRLIQLVNKRRSE